MWNVVIDSLHMPKIKGEKVCECSYSIESQPNNGDSGYIDAT